jgi:WD repeat and SOF domain-containing protein 1
LDKIFAKPFVHSFEGHSDGISAMARCTLVLNKFISGAHDGEVKIWDISERKNIISIYDHTQSVKGVTFSPDGRRFISSSADKSINLYDFQKAFSEHRQDHSVARGK